jgi:two-component system cell cycle response regulator DivK
MSKCILVVEDQEDNRRILRDLLGNAGYELVEAESGEEALTAVEAQRPDLILMDIQLPVMNGYEAARRIKSNPDMKAVPIIAMTAYALAGDESKALAAGCNAYVTKPYSPRAYSAATASTRARTARISFPRCSTSTGSNWGLQLRSKWLSQITTYTVFLEPRRPARTWRRLI